MLQRHTEAEERTEGNFHSVSSFRPSLTWAKREAAVEATGSVFSGERSFPRSRIPPSPLRAATGGSLPKEQRIPGLAPSGELRTAAVTHHC